MTSFTFEEQIYARLLLQPCPTWAALIWLRSSRRWWNQRLSVMVNIFSKKVAYHGDLFFRSSPKSLPSCALGYACLRCYCLRLHSFGKSCLFCERADTEVKLTGFNFFPSCLYKYLLTKYSLALKPRSATDSVLASHPAVHDSTVQFPAFPGTFLLMMPIFFWQHCLEQWTEAW